MFRSWKNVADHPQISILSPPRLDPAGGSYLFLYGKCIGPKQMYIA